MESQDEQQLKGTQDTAGDTSGSTDGAHSGEEQQAADGPATHELSSEELARQREVSLDDGAEVQKELQDMKDKYLRALADFQNLKERNARERSELLKYQGEPLLLDIIPVLDNLELALQYADSDPQKILEGMRMIYKQFVDALEKWGVRGVSGKGELFDPQKQNAISKLSSEEHAPGTVVQELKRAYFYKERLIRPGEVVVADEKEGGAS